MRVYGLVLLSIFSLACSEKSKPVHEALIEMPEALDYPIADSDRESNSYATLQIPACEKLILSWKIPETGNPKVVLIQVNSDEFVEQIATDQSTLAISKNNSGLPDTHFLEVKFAEDYYVTKRTKSSSSSGISSPRLFLRILIETDSK